MPVVGAVITWGVFRIVWASSRDIIQNIVVPAVGGLAALLFWHFGLNPLRRYIWTIPEEEHLSKLEEIAKKDALILRLTYALKLARENLVRCMDKENYDRRDVCVIADTAIGQIDEITEKEQINVKE